MKAITKTIASQPSWIIRGKNVELSLTQLGGQMAPVTFYRNTARPIQPYYISPWQGEGLKIDDPVLVPLRGDFFCMPFGANAAPLGKEQFVCHGEPATKKWRLVEVLVRGKVTSLTVALTARIRPGKFTKTLSLVDGQNVVYSRDVLEGFAGRMPLGHHATLALPDQAGALRVSTSKFALGLTNPTPTGDPAMAQYQSFALGAKFSDLARVPLNRKDTPTGDCSAFPVRDGFDDLLAVFKKASAAPAWTAAVNITRRFLWFSLKDPSVLPATVFWISNRGHHGPPMSGRNLCLGLEDVCGYFAEGLVDSIKANVVSRAGFPTAVALSPKRPTAVNYIQGVVRVPAGFERVKDVRFAPGKVTFTGAGRKKVSATVRHEFLKTGQLS